MPWQVNMWIPSIPGGFVGRPYPTVAPVHAGSEKKASPVLQPERA